MSWPATAGHPGEEGGAFHRGGAETAARYVLLWKIAEVGVSALWRISESWSPILVRLDAMNEHKHPREAVRRWMRQA